MEQEEIKRYYICDYWTRHPHYWLWWYEECECQKRFDCHYLDFLKFLEEKNFKINYASDIKPYMQGLFLKHKFQKNEQSS